MTKKDQTFTSIIIRSITGATEAVNDTFKIGRMTLRKYNKIGIASCRKVMIATATALITLNDNNKTKGATGDIPMNFSIIYVTGKNDIIVTDWISWYVLTFPVAKLPPYKDTPIT